MVEKAIWTAFFWDLFLDFVLEEVFDFLKELPWSRQGLLGFFVPGVAVF